MGLLNSVSRASLADGVPTEAGAVITGEGDGAFIVLPNRGSAAAVSPARLPSRLPSPVFLETPRDRVARVWLVRIPSRAGP